MRDYYGAYDWLFNEEPEEVDMKSPRLVGRRFQFNGFLQVNQSDTFTVIELGEYRVRVKWDDGHQEDVGLAHFEKLLKDEEIVKLTIP